jgi:hypothetical protein
VLAGISPENADAVCLASILIAVNAFAMLNERSFPHQSSDATASQVLQYDPPLDWLRMGKGVGQLVYAAFSELEKAGLYTADRNVYIVADSYPYFGRDKSYLGADMRAPYAALLGHMHEEDEGFAGDNSRAHTSEKWDEETQEAYEMPLSWIGSIQLAIDRGEPVYAVCRRIQGFSYWLPDRFVEFLTERRPRALVALSFFFATVSQIHGVWWLGGNATSSGAGVVSTETTARKEIEAISKAVPAEWRGFMLQPLEMVGLRPFWPTLPGEADE